MDLCLCEGVAFRFFLFFYLLVWQLLVQVIFSWLITGQTVKLVLSMFAVLNKGAIKYIY